MKNKIIQFGIIVILAIIGFVFTACDNNEEDDYYTEPERKTPTVDDFNISGLGTFTYDSTEKKVTITAKEGKSKGYITVKYNGGNYAPTKAGTYTVTFNVGYAGYGSGWNSVENLQAGTIIINPNNSITIGSEANTIVVSGSDIYVFGSYGDYPNKIPCYWKNGERINMPEDCNVFFSTRHTRFNAFAVSGDDVYITGYYDIGNNSKACYWKNGEKVELTLPDDVITSSTFSIAVVGTDVYVSGQYKIGSKWTSCYWKNEERLPLSLPANAILSNTNTIAVVGSDVYVAGGYGFSIRDYYNCYWKNGVRTEIAASFAFTVSGTDWYSAGIDNYNACLVKNGVITKLSTKNSEPLAIAIEGSDIYVLGIDDGVGCYWKNGVKTIGVGGNDITVAGTDVYIATSGYNGLVNYACYLKNGEIIALEVTQ